MKFQPQNILIIDFGQLGDVIMSLPALDAIRRKFPEAKITIMVGKPGAAILEIVGLADEIIMVDRIQLLRSSKLWAVSEIFKIVRRVRLKKYDFVIDLHSFYETNLLGYFSGAKLRLYANRENRSLDFLANFSPKPPLEDKSKHLTYLYLDVLEPLAIENKNPYVTFSPRFNDLEKIGNLLQKYGVSGKTLIGINLGAGHPSRCWDLKKFAEVAKSLSNGNTQILVFFGPEENDLIEDVRREFPDDAIILNELKLPELAAVFTHLKVLIGNDTGPVHLGAIVGTPIVLILDERAPKNFLPLAKRIAVVNTATIEKIPVEDVVNAAKDFLDDTA